MTQFYVWLCFRLFWELKYKGNFKNLQILNGKPQINVTIFIYQTWPIGCGFEVFSRVLNFIVIGLRFSKFHSNKKNRLHKF